MRVLLASDHYPPFVGGAQRQTQVLAAELAARGHEVAVATVWQDELPRRETEGAVSVHRLRQLRTLPLVRGRGRRRHQPPFADPVTVLELRRLLAQVRPEVVHAAGWFSYSAAAALRHSPVPLLVSARDYGFSCATATLVHRGAPCSGPGLGRCLACAGSHYGAPKGWLATLGVLGSRRALRGRADGLHSISRYVREMSERDFLQGRAAPLQDTIPSFRVEDEPGHGHPGLAALPGEPFILFVGALRRVKGIEALLAAYGRLREPPPLVLLGTREADTPRELPPGARIVEAMPHWAVLRAWERSLFGVTPSLWPEPFGSVVHEAMSRGRAVIGTTPGGHEDMIEHGRTGLLVPGGDVDALAAAMRRLIEDGALRERLGAAARLEAERFTAAAAVPRFEAMYAQLLAEAPAGRRRDAGDSVRAGLWPSVHMPRGEAARAFAHGHRADLARRSRRHPDRAV